MHVVLCDCCSHVLTQRASLTLPRHARRYGGTHGRTIIFTDTKREATELALNPFLKVSAKVCFLRSRVCPLRGGGAHVRVCRH
jgi:hypothetical protein